MIAVMVIAGTVAGGVIEDFFGCVAEAIPNRFAVAVCVPCTFDLDPVAAPQRKL